MILDYPELIDAVKAQIDTGCNTAHAWQQQIDALIHGQMRLDNPVLAKRAADLEDVGKRVMQAICNHSDTDSAHNVQAPYILVKSDLLPSDVASLDPKGVKGIITALGGASSHSAIIARSLGIPTLTGVGEAIFGIADGAQLVIHARGGYAIVDPDEATITDMHHYQARQQELATRARMHAHNPAQTTDGHVIEIGANIGEANQTKEAVTLGCDSVGLLRTELMFMHHQKAPNVSAQSAMYRQIFDTLAGRSLVVRTLDVGGGKPLPYLAMPPEDNPFLGVRGVRLSLQHPALLKEQLTALLLVVGDRPLRIMFPMVGRYEEWQKIKAMTDELVACHPIHDLQLGIMIEVPSVAIMADILAPDVDFFSIGTNDLIQCALAIDRGHPVLTRHADRLHPSALRLIDRTVKAANAHGKWVGVCGELGANALAVPILAGLGVDELSVSPPSIALLKTQIRMLNFGECQTLARQALGQNSAVQVRALSQQFLSNQSLTIDHMETDAP